MSGLQQSRILLAAGATVALCVAGCTGTVPDNAANPQVPNFTSTGPVTVPSTVPLPQTTPPTPNPPNPPAEPAPNPPEPPPDQAATSGECKAPELELSIGEGEGATSTVYRPLRFTNKGNRVCVIQGFPGVSYVTGDDGRQVGPAAFREGTKGAPVNLAPGEAAFATVGFAQVGAFDENVCKPTATRGLRVYPPHETAAMFLPMEGTGCAGTPPDPQLRVRTVQKGLG
jgi:Protein of unknown function (DUF4232)